jgi:hypothetical protein
MEPSGDNRVIVAVAFAGERVLAGRDVAAIDAAQPEGFKMPDQIVVTAARLSKRPDAAAAQVRDQRRHRV